MKIAIIGGGAAGMMAAASVIEANPSAQITIYDKNAKLGRKLVITGGGRCNITTAITDVRQLMEKYPRGSRFLRFVMHEFGPMQTMEWFEDHEIKLKTEGARVFPASENGEEVVSMFLQIFKEAEVAIKYGTEVNSLEDLDADKIIITTGGKDGGGYKLAKSVGHNIMSLAATLTSFVADVPKISGVSIEKARLKFCGEEFTGPFLFTHTGITGPAVFALSAFTAYENLDSGVDLFVDFVPDLNREQIMEQMKDDQYEDFLWTMKKYIPKSLVEAFGVGKKRRMNEISKKELAQTVEQLKNYKIRVTGRTPGREIVTAGGVDLNEVDSKTMQSKIDPRLYFAGEVLDVDGITGGFNLQIAWATGRIAGLSSSSN